MTIAGLGDAYVTGYAALDPVRAGRSMGVGNDLPHLTDYSPDGRAAMEDFLRRTAAELAAATPADEGERVGKLYLADQIASELTLLEAGEREQLVSAIVGPPASVRLSLDLLPRTTDDEWDVVASRLEHVPQAMAGYRASLARAAARGAVAGRANITAVAEQCATWADGWFAAYAASGAGSAHAARLDAAAEAAADAYRGLGAWLVDELLPRADATEGVGQERYDIWWTSLLGGAQTVDEAYAWGWDELARLEAQKAEECARIVDGGGFGAALEVLVTDPARSIDGVDAYRAWLQEITDEAIERLDGWQFDIAEPLRRCVISIPPEGSSAAPYYTPPSEDLVQPGRTWFPTLGRTRFPTWDQLTIAYHEAVPGHHLQAGASRSSPLIRAHRLGFNGPHGEGWALYAERLMDELGRFETPDTRLGFLCMQAFRAARVVVDIGLHTGRPIPAGWPGHEEGWSPDAAAELLASASGLDAAFVDSEVKRYLSWPVQATTYKLGERAWLAGRDAARQRHGGAFDLKAWHAAALGLGALGLADLERELARVG